MDFKQQAGQILTKEQETKACADWVPSIEDKHKFLQLSEQMRQSGLRLTERQQHERDTLNADFQALKGKGYKPFLRGSVLMYRRRTTRHVFARITETVPPA